MSIIIIYLKIMKFLYHIKLFIILISLGIGLCYKAGCEELRLKPVSYKSCDPKENLDYSAKNLWDNIADMKHKWCCFHAGYKTPQTHWVIMDIGIPIAISKIIVHHEGNNTERRNLLTEDYKIFGSLKSINGPWFPIREITDNAEQINTIQIPDIKMRYVGLEVTDPQSGEGFNKNNDDWAVRIFEIYIYTKETPPPFSNLYSLFTPTPGAPTSANLPSSGDNPPIPDTSNVFSPASNPELFKTGKTLYYFFNPNVVKCQNLGKMFTSPEVKESLLPYKMESVRSKTDEPLLTQFAVFVVPTLIITDENNKILKRTSNILTEEELLRFLK